MKAWVALMVVGMVPYVGAAQVPARVQFDSVNLTPALERAIEQTTIGMSAWCAPQYRRDPGTWNMWVDSLVRSERTSAPDCAPREAVVLIRRECVFSPLEFVFMRERWGYVVVVCAPNAVGIPLLRFRSQETGTDAR